MAEGRDLVAQELLGLQPTAMLDLFLVYPDTVADPENYYPIHNGSVFKKGIVWQGITYIPIGMEIDGFEINADGRLNRPKIKISNKDYFITNLLRKYNNFENAKVIRKRTFVKFLDDENFDGGNPFGKSNNAAELSSQKYIVSQKVQENKIFVEFELTSPLDLESFDINNRKIMGKYCFWTYRGDGCGYLASPIHKDDGSNFKDINGNILIPKTDNGELAKLYDVNVNYTTGDVVYLINSKVKITDPEKDVGGFSFLQNYYIAKTDVKGLSPDINPDYWEKDGCNKKLSSCKLHFNKEGIVTRNIGSLTKNIKYAAIEGGPNNKAYQFYLEDDSDILGVLSGNNYTIIMNILSCPNVYNTNKIVTESLGLISTNKNGNGGLSIVRQNDDTKALWPGGNSNKFNDPEMKNIPIVIRKKLGSSNNTKNSLWGVKDGYNENLNTEQNGKVKGVHNHFKVGVFVDNNNSLKSPLYTELSSVSIFDKSLTNDQIYQLMDVSKNEENQLTKIYFYKQYKDVENLDFVNNNCVAWWENPYKNENDGTGFNLAYKRTDINVGDLLYSGSGDKINVGDYDYESATLKDVAISEVVSFLPFGGFPGTDGYDFTRE